ncbi:acetyltransferase [Cellulomonas chitinilytica]|uniref:Lysine N-acyltransferase MbtK n=1 Tax=Cellulomonas chitinilytica TaxID=398759 RepID=A0A919P582_9CELL|nr:GNAT family N-acetyltransferase [Cellulomonas chitinilytica]GIG23463.1 acetyltransferase [Cellulomonas chitinilytica]
MTAALRLAAGSRGEVVHARVVDGLGNVRVRVLDPDADLDTVHGWVTGPGTRFWGLGDLPRDELRDLYAYVDSLPTHHAFVVTCDDEPAALLQTYEPAHDPVGDTYDVLPGDVGVHLLVGRAGRAGFATRLLGALVEFLFAQPGARRIVVEPDVRNDRVLARMRRLGFVVGPVVRLPHKDAQLAFLDRPTTSPDTQETTCPPSP